MLSNYKIKKIKISRQMKYNVYQGDNEIFREAIAVAKPSVIAGGMLFACNSAKTKVIHKEGHLKKMSLIYKGKS